MRILMVCPSYQPQAIGCGVGDYTRLLAEQLAAGGDDVEVLCGSGYRGPIDGAVRVRPIVESWSPWALLRLATAPASADLIDFQFTPVLYGRHSALRLWPALLKLRRRRVPAVVTLHSLSGRSLGSRLAAGLMLLAARGAIGANEEVTAMLARRAPRLARKTIEVPIGSNVVIAPAAPAELQAVRAHLGAGPGDPLLAHFGLVYPGKGLETLFRALGTLRGRHPGARLAIAGETRAESRDYRETLERLAADLGVAGAIQWTGRLEPAEVSRLLQAADLYVVPYDGGVSIRRGTLMAGLAHGLPVISTTPAVPSAHLRDGENVSLVPPGDPGALAARLIELVEAPDRRAALGEGARELAAAFSWPRIAATTRSAFAQVARS
ncbi:MAG TPA: glycosyltransferase [Acidobacteriota bacterium]